MTQRNVFWTPSDPGKNGDTLYEGLRFALHCIARYPGSFCGVALLVFCSTALILPVPLLSKAIVNLVEVQGDPWKIVFYGLLALGAVTFERCVSYWHGVIIFRQYRMLLCDLRLQVLDHVLTTPLALLAEEEPTALGARIFNDTDMALSAFYDNLISVCENAITVLVCLVAMAIIALKPTLLVMAAIPVYVFLLGHFGERIRLLTDTFYDATAEDNGLYCNLLGAPEVAKMHSKTYLTDSFTRSFAVSIRAADRMMRMRAASYAVILWISNVLPVAILMVCAFLILGGSFNLGAFVALSAFMAYLFPALRRTVEYFVSAQGGVVGLTRVNELLRLPRESLGVKTTAPGGRHLTLRDLSFRYGEQERGALEGISLTLARGDLLVIMGESGSGKTTLLKIIAGLFEQEKGDILLDGEPLPSADRRRMTAYVEQEPFVFADSLVENVRLGRDWISTSQARQVLASVGLQGLLDSEDTAAGEDGPNLRQGGSNLSLGQKKRIALARALVKDADIIVIDEPTSGLDAENASRVMETIRRVCRDRFVIVVSHAENAIDEHSRVCILEGGRLHEPGRQ